MPPGPDVGTLLGLRQLAVRALLGVDQLHIAVVLLRLLVHKVKDPLGAGGGVDDEVHLLAHLGDGLGEALVEAHEGDDRGQVHPGHVAVDGQDGA